MTVPVSEEYCMALPIISTIRDRCRRCYACIRQCPAKAIRVRDGQAEVMVERCIACGRCVGVCSQGAKEIRSHLEDVNRLLAEAGDVVALLAPSFPAAFPDWRPNQVVAALKRVGFAAVCEVAFGADLVSRAYYDMYQQDPSRVLLTTPCPATVTFIAKHAGELVPLLAPILSPMAAVGKALKERLRPGCATVFFGPCTAKIREREDASVAPWIDVATIFPELERLLADHGVDPAALNDALLDPPYSNLGSVYPLPGGLLRAANLPCDLLETSVATIVGRDTFVETVNRMKARVQDDSWHLVEAKFFDVLFCKGCTAGPGMPHEESPIIKRQRVTSFLRQRREPFDLGEWETLMARLADLDLTRPFNADPQPKGVHAEADIRSVLDQMGKPLPADELNCGACGYLTCRDKAAAVLEGDAEVEMCLPHLIERLQATIEKLNLSHEELQAAQAQLLRSEQMASMGQLAAGIAHELNNPLGAILIYAHLLQESAQTNPQTCDDAAMILAEATRCRNIVRGLLDFARQNEVTKRPANLRVLIEDTVNVLRRQIPQDNIHIHIETTPNLPLANVDAEQIKQVLINLIRNAAEFMPNGGTVTIRAAWNAQHEEFSLSVSDTGPGIRPEHMTKLFTPFFTTKPVGQGTGLGLPICYGIVKMHRGSITAQNNPDGPGATFSITLPQNADGATDRPNSVS